MEESIEVFYEKLTFYDIIQDALLEEDEGVDYNKATIEDALCEEDEVLNERLGVIEDVLCELDERINGDE